MTQRDLVVKNRLGLHARAAAKIVHLTAQFSSQIDFIHAGDAVDAKSILGILMLGAAQGTELTVRCDGEDEEQALEAIIDLFAKRFEEKA